MRWLRRGVGSPCKVRPGKKKGWRPGLDEVGKKRGWKPMLDEGG